MTGGEEHNLYCVELRGHMTGGEEHNLYCVEVAPCEASSHCLSTWGQGGRVA